MRNRIGVALGALLLAGCGGGTTSSQSESDSSAAGAGQGASAANATIELPYGFTLYPGAQVVTSSDINVAQGSGKLVVMTSPDSPDELLDHYRTQAKAAGITIQQEMITDKQKLLGGDGPNGISMVFSASESPEGTTAQLVVGQGAG